LNLIKKERERLALETQAKTLLIDESIINPENEISIDIVDLLD
jgi:hypothetical protein